LIGTLEYRLIRGLIDGSLGAVTQNAVYWYTGEGVLYTAIF